MAKCLDSLIDSSLDQVYLCLSKKDYFVLRLLFKSLDKKNLLSPGDRIIVERFNNSIIDIVDCVGTSLFDRERI